MNNRLWVVGAAIAQFEDEDGDTSVSWEMVGVFTDEQEALKHADTEAHFIGPVELDKPCPFDEWPGLYWPLVTGPKS